MQFQTFMQTMGERVIAPMVQEMQIHPTSVRPYMGAGLGIALGVLSDGARMHIRGEGDEWNRRWSDGEGMRDILYAGMLRSPWMPGSSAMISEMAMTAIGRPVNDGLESIGLPRVLGEAQVKFHERNAFKSLLGPGVGQLQSVGEIGQKIIGGEYEKAWDQSARRIPLYNVWYIQALTRMMEK